MHDANSNARLAAVHPALAAKVNAAADRLAAKNIFFRVAQGLRTYAEQDGLYALGRTITKKSDGTHQGIVTNARAGYGNHNFGFAVDCYPFAPVPEVEHEVPEHPWASEEGAAHPATVGKLNMTNPKAPEWVAMVEAMKAEGLVWGGDWHSIPDAPHFQLSEVATTPTAADRLHFEHGGLKAVWEAYSKKITSQDA